MKKQLYTNAKSEMRQYSFLNRTEQYISEHI